MKRAGVMATVAICVLGLQGCATTGTTAADSSWQATGPNSAMMTTDAPDKPIVRADTKADFEAIVAAINKQMAPGGRWQYVNSSERATVDGTFADMGKLYDKYGSVAAMDADAKLRLATDQSNINAVLTQRDGNKLVCQSVIPVGSHLPVKMCKTYAQIQAEQQATRRQMDDAAMRNDYQKVGGH